jgi:hypothetical protein
MKSRPLKAEFFHVDGWTYIKLIIPVSTAWRILRLRMEERPPVWKVAKDVSNKQLWKADKG